jgi:excinuclease ABC subunit B
MQNTYQDLITAVQNKNPAISPKLEGGKKFQMKTDFKPAGDQPEAIKQLVNGANKDQLKSGITRCNWIWKNFYDGKGN